jgi:hypothetical protein
MYEKSKNSEYLNLKLLKSHGLSTDRVLVETHLPPGMERSDSGD